MQQVTTQPDTTRGGWSDDLMPRSIWKHIKHFDAVCSSYFDKSAEWLPTRWLCWLAFFISLFHAWRIYSTWATSIADEELVPKKDSTSVEWQWFGYERSDFSQGKVSCKLCQASVGTSNGNKANLFNHLKRKHPKEHGQCVFYSGWYDNHTHFFLPSYWDINTFHWPTH